MLSILIPIYNFKVEKLVKALMRQANRLDIDYEILCFDDGSRKSIKYENSILSDYFGVNYTELSANLGRARIRNWLAKSASFENLIFLDCDSKIVNNGFIKNYIKEIKDYDLIAGGTVYSKKAPRAKSKKLHWLYGSKREVMSAGNRQKQAGLHFHSNNFMVRRSLILDFPFDENIKGYGYEDLEWADKLLKEGKRIKHIENPVEHLGLDKASDFIKKQKRSLENLYELHISKGLETQLTNFVDRINKWGIQDILYRRYVDRLPDIEEKLRSDKPSLLRLQLFKLIYFLRITKNKM